MQIKAWEGIAFKLTQCLGKVYHTIIQRMIKIGQAPHYIEIATELGVPVEDGRKALHELMRAVQAIWLFPDTDCISSFS
jgi:hypothetical protein